MEWTRYQVILIVTMATAGTLNALWIGLGTRQVSMGTLRPHTFDHIFLWAEAMFLGEFSCLWVYLVVQWYRRSYGNHSPVPGQFNPLLFLPPALMDMGGTIMLYVGIHMTYDQLQIFRGVAYLIFCSLLSVAVLRFTITKTMWVGIAITVAALSIIGVLEATFYPGTAPKSDNWKIAGALFIIVGEFLYTVQINYEETFVKRYDVSPLEARGLEGMFGASIIGIFLLPFYYINGGSFFVSNPYRSVEDVREAFEQMHNNYVIVISYLGYIVSKAFYNWAQMSMIKQQHATTTIILNTLQAIPTWLMSMAIGWTHFIGYEVIGYALQIVGICVYCDVVFAPFIRRLIANHRTSPYISPLDRSDDDSPLLVHDPQSQPTQTLRSIVSNVVRSR